MRWATNGPGTAASRVLTGILNVSLYISVYKLIALLNLEDHNDPLIKLAIGRKISDPVEILLILR